MRLFDTHCHFDFSVFSAEFSAHHQAALQQGVERFVIPAIGPENWPRLASLSDYSGVYYALGFHPYFLRSESAASFNSLIDLLDKRSPRCVAVGETGLDWAIEVDRHLQQEMFLKQIELAQAYQLPLILHSRKSDSQIIKLLKQARFSQGGVWHGFSGSEQQAKAFIDAGFKIGVGGVITYPRANKTRRAVAALPASSLVLETDAPDMPMYGLQGQPNHSKYLPRVLHELATLRNLPSELLAEQLWHNSHQLFALADSH